VFTNRHHHHIDKLLHLKDKLSFIYTHLILQSFALSLIGVFIPIFLYTIGFDLRKIILFILVQWIFFGGFSPVYARIVSKIGLKEVIIIRTPLLILNLFLLYILPGSHFLQSYVYVLAALEGISGALYTMSITSLFAKHIGIKQQGKRTAKFMAFPRMASVIAPAIGGFIALEFGFPLLFLLVLLILTISLIPIFFLKENIDHPGYKSLLFKDFKKHFKEFITLNGYAMRGVALGILLPIAIYLYKQNTFSLGVVTSLSALASAMLYIYLGSVVDKKGINNFIRFGGVYTGVLMVLMGIYIESYFLVVLAVLIGFNTVPIAYETHLYREAKKHRSPLEFISFKEFSLFIGRSIFLLFLLFITIEFDTAFYIGALASLVFVFF